jgi:hypothetical protein
MLDKKRIFTAILVCVLIFTVSPAMATSLQQGDLTLLVYGQTVDGRLDSSQPSVFYAFDAQAGDVITITMVAADSLLDPFIVLNDANRVPLATDDNSGGSVNARLTFVIPMSGRYIIQATTAGGVPPEGGGGFGLNLTAAVDTSPVPTPPPADVVPTETPAASSDTPAVQGDSVRLLKLQSGASIQDKLDRQVALRFYWFEGQQGDQIAVTPEQVSSFQPLFVLYDADFTELSSSSSGSGFQVILAQAGVVFLVASLPDPGNAGGNYGFVFDVSSNPAAAGNFIDIAYNQSLSGNIDANVPAVTYRFQGAAGDAVTVAMSRAGGDLNSYLYVLDSTGQLLYEDDDSGGENGNARLTYTLPASGQYLIMAARLGQARGTTSGSYVLDLTSDAAPAAVEATAVPSLPSDYMDFPIITYGQTVEGELSSTRFLDVYVFLGNAGDAITIDLQSGNIDDPNGLDPTLVLLDDARIPLIENDDIVDGVQRDSRIEFTLPRTAYYGIVATRFDQENGVTAGPYSLTLTGPGGTVEPTSPTTETSEPPIQKLSPALLTPDTPLQATFDKVATLYRFNAVAGALVDISATTDPGLDSVLILADQDLNEILSSGTGALTGITLPQTGEYLVILAPRFGPISQPGGYILALTQTAGGTGVPAVSGPQMIAYGDTIQGVIDDQNITQVYTFDGAANDRVRITMKAAVDSALDCYLELQDAGGTVLEANDDINPGVVRDSQITVELPAAGTYTLIASRYVGTDAEPTTGNYSLSLELLTGPTTDGASTEITPITYGQTEVGEINDQQYIVFYTFDGIAGDAVTIEVDNMSGNLDSVLHLYSAAGTQWTEIANNDDSATGGTYEASLSDIILPQTGKYLIAVNRYGLDRESTYGTFMITVTRRTS